MVRSRYYVLNDRGEVVPEYDSLKWARWFETAEHRLAADYIEGWAGTLLVSTVFLGLDHNFTPGGPPLIWETMVFNASTNSWFDLLCRRYGTREEALAGHAAVLAEVKGHRDE